MESISHSKANRQLLKKYQDDFDFHKTMDQKKYNFDNNKAKAIITETFTINQDILERFSVNQYHEIYFYYAFLQPENQNKFPELILYLIKNFNPEFHKKYTFVFFNNCCKKNSTYFDFKRLFMCLPIQFFLSLDQVIFIKPSLSHKISQWWSDDILDKFWNEKCVYAKDATYLCAKYNIAVNDLLRFLPQKIVQNQFPTQKKNLHQINLIDHRINVRGQQMSEQQRSEQNHFYCQINSFFQKSGSQAMDIEQYEFNERKVPIILQNLVYYFQEHQEGLQLQGLFRKSVSIDEQNETLAQLLKHNFQYLKEITNAHLIANLIKRFFAKLKTPIIPYESFKSLMHDEGVKDKLALVRDVIHNLPKQNYFSLMYLIEFLKFKVLPQQKHTKMNSKNLAICFAPCLMRAQKQSIQDLIYASKSTIVTNTIIDHFEQIFGDQQQRIKIVKKTSMQDRKKFESSLNESIQSGNFRNSISKKNLIQKKKNSVQKHPQKKLNSIQKHRQKKLSSLQKPPQQKKVIVINKPQSKQQQQKQSKKNKEKPHS